MQGMGYSQIGKDQHHTLSFRLDKQALSMLHSMLEAVGLLSADAIWRSVM
jgi:hypothetical protein